MYTDAREVSPISLLVLLLWLVFSLIVLINTRNNSGQILLKSRRGTLHMNLQYTALFVFLSICVFSDLVKSVGVLKSLLFCFPTCHVRRYAEFHVAQSFQLSDFLGSLASFCLFHHSYFPILVLVGLLLVLFGLVVYFVSLRTLATNYFPFVGLTKGQLLCSKGIYGYIRHPLYAGQCMMILGSALVVQHTIFYFCLPLVYALYLFTITEEERLLELHFSGYRDYKKKTRMLIPCVF